MGHFSSGIARTQHTTPCRGRNGISSNHCHSRSTRRASGPLFHARRLGRVQYSLHVYVSTAPGTTNIAPTTTTVACIPRGANVFTHTKKMYLIITFFLLGYTSCSIGSGYNHVLGSSRPIQVLRTIQHQPGGVRRAGTIVAPSPLCSFVRADRCPQLSSKCRIHHHSDCSSKTNIPTRLLSACPLPMAVIPSSVRRNRSIRMSIGKRIAPPHRPLHRRTGVRA